MTSSPSVFQVRCGKVGVMAFFAMIIIAIIITASILPPVLADYFGNSFTYRSLAPLTWLIPIYPCFAGLNRLKSTLFRFAEGEVFTQANATDIKFLASRFIITVLLMTFVVPGIHAILSYGWHGRWWIDIEPGDIAAIFLAIVLWIFGWLVSEGSELKSENESFI